MKTDYVLLKFVLFIFAPALLAGLVFLFLKAKRKITGKDTKGKK